MSKPKYDKVSQREHVLLRPGMYIGHVKKTTEPMWLYKKKGITKGDISFIPGLYKIFDEIVVNARDHSVNDKTCNSIEIEVNVDDGYFSVYNNGDNGIPVKEHEKHKTLIPSMIFGELLTSSNYDDSKKRTTGGLNGLGSKVTGIWSKKFEVEVQDKSNKKHFHQIWEDNMSKVNPAKVTKKSTKSYVKVTCYPDLERFKLKSLKTHLPLFQKRAYDLALTTEKVKVKFNGEDIKLNKFQDFMDLYFPDTEKIVDTSNPRMRVGCVYLPDIGHETISYVNGICTYRGGTHCNYVVDMVVKSLINDYIKKKNKDVKVTPAVVKDNLVFFIDSVIDNPSFSSQSKETLTTKASDFGTTYKLNKSFMNKLSKSGIVQQIISLAKFKESSKLNKTDGKKTSKVRGIPKLEDANKAGTKDAHKCGLYLAEGDSAASMILSGLSSKDRNYYGVFPLKGKLLNVREASVKQIMGNEEITNLKKILGLRNEYKYEIEEEFNTLRYGKVIALTDQDYDGSHIKGLIMNMFHSTWPALLKREGFFTTMNTPIVKAIKGKTVLQFYNLTDYEDWKKENNDGKGYYIKYYKGLGTSDSKEAKEYFKDIEGSTINYVWDETEKGKNKTISDDALELAFSKELADRRKKWLISYDKNSVLDSKDKKVPIPDFIHKDLIHFSNDDTQRSIPSLVDGFKPSQRKIFYGAQLRGLEKDQVKVAQLAGFVSDRVAYHHGEASLMGAIIGMAQNFVGSNNLNVLEPKGQFGCLDPETDILLWNGTIKKAKDITLTDKLVGDDGRLRNISKIIKGEDTMYRIKNGIMKDYIVNSCHILTCKYSSHKSIYWKESTKSWKMNYYDKNSKYFYEKTIGTNEKKGEHFNKSKKSKEEAYNEMIKFSNKIDNNPIFDINLEDYLKLPKYIKHHIKGVVNRNIIEWKEQPIDIDPYILGCWLGDGMSDCHGFSSIDPEIIKSWAIWLDKIGCEIVHCPNYNNHESCTYYIRRVGSNKKSDMNYPIGHKDNSSKICKGCITSNINTGACDWVFNKNNDNYICDGVNSNNHKAVNLNPFKEIMKKNKLFKNKHVPLEYIVNSKDNRLQILAGMIDTDGSIGNKKQSISNYRISQCKERRHILESMSVIASSLGYRSRICTYKRNMLELIITGPNLELIPVRVKRKRINNKKAKKDFHSHHIKVEKIGRGEFCGWHIDSNERFLLGDFTITHNTRLGGGKDHASPRYIWTKLEKVSNLVFRKEDNPILNYQNDDGQMVEPDYFLPIIPMILVNGATGIGTGFSTSIPCYKPTDLIGILKNMINGEKYKKIHPYYRKFNGKIKKLDVKSYEVRGLYTKDDKKGIVEISELPVGEWTNNYKQYLEKLLDNDTNFSSYDNNSTDEIVSMKLKFKKLPKNLDSKLKMVRKINLTNLHAYTSKGNIQKFKNIDEIILEFYGVRLEGYYKRKEYLLKIYKHQADLISYKVKFIKEIIAKTLKINNRKKADIERKLEEKKYPKMGKSLDDEKSYTYLLGMNLYSLTKEKIEELEKQKEEREKMYSDLKKTTPEELWEEELDELNEYLEK